ncbi:Dual specificity protein phosphatase 18 [Triplophysa tibetana]|uniref:Dual specificity protein phosphatase 18 n=1 Tax=Triplophysa tibetana TaxID=1572043 RepID=A0A5A9PDP9_9TELE|nr:Dual specificity protein phosphatase 18 [Triplophysa tibetana]
MFFLNTTITTSTFRCDENSNLNYHLRENPLLSCIVFTSYVHRLKDYKGLKCRQGPFPISLNARLCDHFEHVAARIHNNRTGGTLVHCAAGMSRSPALIMAYLMKHKGVTLRQAHNWVKDSRPYIRLNSGFWAQLLDYEKKLYGKNTVKVAEPLDPLPLPKTPRLAPKYNMRRSITEFPPSPRLGRVGRYTSIVLYSAK